MPRLGEHGRQAARRVVRAARCLEAMCARLIVTAPAAPVPWAALVWAAVGRELASAAAAEPPTIVRPMPITA